MIIFFEIPWIFVLIPIAVIGLLLFSIGGSFLDVKDSVQAFADANTFYIMLAIAAVLLAIVLISVILKSDGFKDAVRSFFVSLPFVISITLGLTNAWTTVPSFFEQFDGFDDIFVFIIFGWIIFLVSIVILGFFAVLFSVSGFVPLIISYCCMEEKGKDGTPLAIGLSIPIIILNLLALLNLTSYFTNSIANIF